MSHVATDRPRKSLPSHLHDLIEAAPWRVPPLDWAARLAGGDSAEVARVRRRPAVRLAPVRRPSVSVIIPCFNYGRFLPGAVASAVDQSAVDVEVVVVDDASTDDSAEVAASLADTDGRVRLVRNDHNLGHVRTFNRGLEVATGELIVRLDADDLLTPGSLDRAAALFEAEPRVGLVYGHPRHFESTEPPAPRTGRVTWTVWDGQSWVRERCRRGVNCITTPEAVVRADVVAEVGALNTNLAFAQDMEMWLRVAAVSDVGRLDDVDQALHRDHDGSMSANEGSGLLTDLVERRQVFRELFASVGDRFADLQALEQDYRTALAREALAEVAYELDRRRGDQELVTALSAFARETDPGCEPQLQAVLRRGEAESTEALRPLLRVAGHRLRDELSYLRWTRTGL